MKKKTNDFGLTVYSDKLDNGLEIYVIPDNNVNNTYATYNTRYGGMHNSFIPYNENKIKDYPKGIAHFLEHKMFEQEDESDVFKYFSEHGSDANANTNYRKTTYLFSGPNAFYENLEFLLNYVESPYFTDENVEKEKGIILEELEMYQDKPYSRIYEGCLYNCVVNHPMKYPIIGTRQSIKSITKEQLYDCYNTFYNPSNMFVVVTGNVDPEEVIKRIKKHEEKRKIKPLKQIRLKEYKEPNKVAKEYEEITMDVTIPKIALAYKINIEKFKKMDTQVLYDYIMNFFDLRLGTTSLLNEKLRDQSLISFPISLNGIFIDSHIIVVITFETNYQEEVIELIQNELKDVSIKEDEFERRKKAKISDLYFMTDNIFKTNSFIATSIINGNEIKYNRIEEIRSTKIDEVNKVLGQIELLNKSIFVINRVSVKSFGDF